MNEFSTIDKYFLPLAQRRGEALGLKDDAAILAVPKGYELVVSSDTLGAGTHFLADEKPGFIAHKALRVNLSDLAAMGAKPYAYQLCIAFPKKPAEKFLKEFTGALLEDQKKFGIFCSGGDTTITKGPLTISITAFGLVPKGEALKRGGAKPGDVLVITGRVGDALTGLKILQKKLKIKSKSAVATYRIPMPRTAVTEIIRTHARAGIDISDGLVADVGHICRASRCAADIHIDQMSFSKAARALDVRDLITGGDDYELALAVPRGKLASLLKKLRQKGLKPQVIGAFKAGKPKVRVFNKHRPVSLVKAGWAHF